MTRRIWIVVGLVAVLTGPAVAKDKAADDLSGWMGMWKGMNLGSPQHVSIAPGIGGGLTVDAYVMYSDEKTIGTIPAGSFGGQVPAEWVRDGQVRIGSAGGEIIPADEAGENDCVVDMVLVSDQVLIVTDNGRCAGYNMSFTETYRRVD